MGNDTRIAVDVAKLFSKSRSLIAPDMWYAASG